MSDDQMKENVPTPETVSTPPPLTPKDALAVEEIRKRNQSGPPSYQKLIDSFYVATGDISTLLSIVAELHGMIAEYAQSAATVSEENKSKDEELDACLRLSLVLGDQLASAQAQLRRKDEALDTAQSKIRRFEEAISSSLDDARRGYEEDIVLGGNDAKYFQWIINCFEKIQAALADGKEGGR